MYSVPILESHLCATTTNGKIPAEGDSGGPLVLESNGEFVQIGIISCSPNSMKRRPVVFTRITSFLSWIHTEINYPNDCNII